MELDNKPESQSPAGQPLAPATEPLPLPDKPTLPVIPVTKKDKSSNKWLVIGLAVLLVIVVGGYFAIGKKAKPPVLTNISVRLEWVNNPEFAGMYAAQDMGYYKAAGLNVDLKEFQDTTDVNKEVADGTVDYGVSTPLEVILARDHGDKNKAIAAIYQTSPFSIASEKSSSIKTPADFAGKILGDTGNNNEAKVTYQVLMAAAGIKPSDATIKPVDFDVVKVFTDNEAQTADLYRNDQSYVLNQAGISFNQIFPEQFGFAIYGDVLIASDTKISQKPAQVQAFVSATMKGWQYVINNPSKTLAVLSKHDNILYKDPAYAKYDLNSTIPLIKTTGGQSLGNMEYVPWNRAYQGEQTAGLLKDSFDVNQFYTSRFVN